MYYGGHKRRIRATVAAVALAAYGLLDQVTYAASAGEVQGKITNALKTIQTVLTSIAVLVAVVAAIFIVLKRLPLADDPMVKNEMFRGVGTVLGGLALIAALIWLVPWIYSLFV